jgi:hypothetical protein
MRKKGTNSRGLVARACAPSALRGRTVAQHGAVHTPGNYSTAWCAIHKTTARRARRSARADELQYGIRLQHGAHGAVRILGCDSTARLQHGAHGAVSIPGSDSTARCATHTPQHGTHGAVRTPGRHSTAQYAVAPQLFTGHSTARTAQCTHRGATAQRSALQHLSNTQCTHKPEHHIQGIAGRRATRARPKHTRDTGAPHTLARAWRTRRRAIGLRC